MAARLREESAKQRAKSPIAFRWAWSRRRSWSARSFPTDTHRAIAPANR